MKKNSLPWLKPFLAKAFCLALTASLACEDFTEVGPPKTRVVSAAVYESDATAIAAINGIYSEMMTGIGFASGASSSVTFLCGLSADELSPFGTSQFTYAFYNNSLTAADLYVRDYLWKPAYQYIYFSNSVLAGLFNSRNATQSIKRQLTGEAKFIRAFCHFYLVNLFDDIPLITTTDYRVNAIAPRSPKSEIYNHIIQDLIDARELLSNDYSYSNGERVRPNKWAATALLARVYLFAEQWENAEVQASIVIANSSLFDLVDLDQVFLKNSKEAIWQLRPVSPGINTNEGNIFVAAGGPNFAVLSSALSSAFEAGDERRAKWVNSIFSADGQMYLYPYKYKIRTGDSPLNEYSMVLRLAEQYLIRAEARIRRNNLPDAIHDLNTVRMRANLPGIQDINPSITEQDLLFAIEKERCVELFTEWGHRWLDLRRLSRIDAVLGPTKSDWQTTDRFYPIPQTEREANTNLSQNLGY